MPKNPRKILRRVESVAYAMPMRKRMKEYEEMKKKSIMRILQGVEKTPRKEINKYRPDVGFSDYPHNRAV